MSVDVWVVLSNLALVIVTALAVWSSFREGHRHEEVETEKIAKIAHELLKAEAADHADAEEAMKVEAEAASAKA